MATSINAQCMVYDQVTALLREPVKDELQIKLVDTHTPLSLALHRHHSLDDQVARALRADTRQAGSQIAGELALTILM